MKKFFKQVWRVIKIVVCLLVLLVVDQTCTHRNIAAMPDYTTEHVATLYTIYKPSTMKMAYETWAVSLAEQPEAEGFMDNAKRYVTTYLQMDNTLQIAFVMPLIVVVFVLVILTMNLVMKHSTRKFKMTTGTTRATIVK